MKFSIVSSLLALAPGMVMAMPASEPSSMVEKRQTYIEKMNESERLVFQVSLSSFLAHRSLKTPSWLIWTSDGCTSSPENPLGWSFYKACYRHDFGYRNWKAIDRFTTTHKDRIDNKFKSDMYQICDEEAANAVTRTTCKALANDYYNIMRLFTKRGDVEQAEIEYEAAVARVKRELEERGIDIEAGEHLAAREVEDLE